MGSTLDLGSRIELVPIDSHFHEITVALYEDEGPDGPEFRVHSYSGKTGTDERIEFIREAMTVLGGMERVGDGQALRFPCGAQHLRACKRVFLEACKLTSGDGPPQPRPLAVFDKKADRDISALPDGGGTYRVTADGSDDNTLRRLSVVCGGLVKLGDMNLVSEEERRIAFECGFDHHALTGLLLVRAPNVRAVIREQEETTSRGSLVAPSAQE